MKNYEKIVKLLGEDTIAALDSSDAEGLNKVIVSAETAMRDVQDELDRNEKYTEIKAQKLAAEQSKKDVFKRQKAKIAYALELLSSKGK